MFTCMSCPSGRKPLCALYRLVLVPGLESPKLPTENSPRYLAMPIRKRNGWMRTCWGSIELAIVVPGPCWCEIFL